MLAAIAQVLIGAFGLIMFDPEYRKKFFPLKLILNPDYLFFDVNKDLPMIKRANKLSFYFCCILAFLTAVNGILHISALMPDFKEVLIKATIIGFFLFRYFCLFLLSRTRKQMKGIKKTV